VFRPVPSGRSDAQTESAFFPGLFARYILGIVPTKPGLREVVLRYYDSQRLWQRSGGMPTPRGLLEVDWLIRPSTFEIDLVVPPATTVRLDLSSLGLPALGDITIDGDVPSGERLSDGLLAITPGNHQIRIQRP
jgi:hypothetical protein